MKNLRTFAIVDYLKEKKYCSIIELQEHFGVSSATIHRDIASLVSRDVIQKVHGGVAIQENSAARSGKKVDPSPFMERINWNRKSKLAISQRAFSYICEGDILFLDSSTTVSYLADLLIGSNFSNLTIVTNSVTIIANFHRFPSHFVLISLGGSFDLQLNAFLGQTAVRELERLSISKAFISAFGVNDDDVTTNHENHASLLTKVLDMAQQKYLLADKSKFNRCGLFKLASKRSFDEIISD